MARKRMFDSEIINQDSFLDLPMEAKALYFLLGMEADDEGFVSPKKVLRLHGGSNDSLKILIAKNYIIPFETGVVVITDWKRNNYLNKNKVKETIYQEEKKQLIVNDTTEKYELIECKNVIGLTEVKPELKQSLNDNVEGNDEKASSTNGLTKVKTKFNESLTRVVENRVEEISIEENSSSSVNNILYNPDVQKINDLMLETIGTTNINNIKECISYLDKLPVELIEYALRKTARISNPSWQYTIPILESYITKKFKTIAEVQADDLKHKNKNKNIEKTETIEEQAERLKREWGISDED